MNKVTGDQMERKVPALEYQATPRTITDGEYSSAQCDDKGNLKVAISSDIEIGQVELKDADSTAQANIKAANTARTTGTVVVATQHIDAAGNVGGVQGSIASGAADSGNPVKVGGKYNATPPTIHDGDRADLQVDASGNTKVNLATTLDKTNDSVTNYEAGWNATLVDLSTDADVVVTASPAYLKGYTVDTAMSAHDAIIKDSATAKFTIPASSAAGFDRDTRATIFATNITVESNDAATGKVIVFWRNI